MSIAVCWSEFTIEAWAGLLDAAKEKGCYLYQTCKYESGSLILSYEVMKPSQYESSLKTMYKIECAAELSLGVLQACKRETRKLSLSDVFSITGSYLNEKSVREHLKGRDLGKVLRSKVMEESKEVEAALGEILGSIQVLSAFTGKFYDERVASHREGFFGRLREIISLVQDVFHKSMNGSLVKIFEAKGHQARCKEMAQCVETVKRDIAFGYLKAMDVHVVKTAPQLGPDSTPPPKQSRRQAVTPFLEKVIKTPGAPKEAQEAQALRKKLKEYLGISSKDPVEEDVQLTEEPPDDSF